MAADRSGPVRVVIVGTGTGVGKTHLGVALVRVLAARGEQVVGLKPIESGVESPTTSDAGQLAAASTFHVKHRPPYLFTDAVSPHLAARRAGVPIELETVCTWVDANAAPWTIVETAGGLLSPLGSESTNLDLARALRPSAVVLVGQDRLGVLHEVSACSQVLRLLAPGMPPPLVVLQAPPVADTSTGTNAAELLTLRIANRVVSVPRGRSEDSNVAEAASGVAERLGSP